MNNILIASTAILLLVGCSQQPPQPEPVKQQTHTQTEMVKTTQVEHQPTPTQTQEKMKTYTMADIEAHNSIDSCYTTINGIVYDITSYIPIHKGGERDIMKICGRDGTSMFTRKHGGDTKPENQLASMQIGILKP